MQNVNILTRDELNISSDVNVWAIKLTDALISSVQMRKLRDLEVGYFSGRLVMSTDSNTPVLDLPPPHTRWSAHNSVAVGDMKLSQLRT